jgi:hypothetical protein
MELPDGLPYPDSEDDHLPTSDDIPIGPNELLLFFLRYADGEYKEFMTSVRKRPHAADNRFILSCLDGTVIRGNRVISNGPAARLDYAVNVEFEDNSFEREDVVIGQGCEKRGIKKF